MNTEQRIQDMIRSLEIEQVETAYKIPQGPPGPPHSIEQMIRDIDGVMRPPIVLVFTFYGEAAKIMPKGTIIYQKKLPEWLEEEHRKAGKKITSYLYIRDDDEAEVLAGMEQKGILYELAPNNRRD